MTEDSPGSWRRLDAQELRADRNTAIGADPDLKALAPDKGPPRAVGFGAQHGTFLFESQLPGLSRSHFEFAVDLVLIAVQSQGLDVSVRVVQVGDGLAGEVGRQAFLPIKVGAFDFALSLGCRSKTESDAIEVKGLTQLSKGLGIVSEEQAVIIDVELQRQAILGESPGQEIKVSQQDFPLINSGTGKDPAAVIEHIEHGKGLLTTREPAVWGGVQLPKLTDLAALPAPNRSRRTVIGLGVGQPVFDGPTANLSPIHLELTLAKRFAGSKTVGSWGAAAEPFS